MEIIGNKSPGGVSDFVKRIDRVRDLRLQQKVQQAVKDFTLLLSELHCKRSDFCDENWQKKILDSDLRSKIIAAEASFLRREGDLELSDKILFQKNLVPVHETLFQLGINALVRDNKETALHYFKRSLPNCPDGISKLSTLYNILICLEDFGVDHENYRQMFDRAFAQSSTEDRKTFAPTYAAYASRMAFRRCENGFFSNLDPESLQHQSLFFCAFALRIMQVTYGSWEKQSDILKNAYLTSVSGSDEYAFEVQTNTLLIRFKGKEPLDFRSHHFAERLYLWTWVWLQTQDMAVLIKINSLMHMHWNSNFVFSNDDKQQIRCAISWITLCGLSENYFHSARWWNQIPQPDRVDLFYPRYQDELKAIKELKSGQKVTLSWLAEFCEKRFAMFSPDLDPTTSNIYLDLKWGQISLINAGQEKSDAASFVNEEVCRVVYHMQQSPVMDLREFYTYVWNPIPNIHERHRSRVLNFIKHLNFKLRGFARISMREDSMRFISDATVVLSNFNEFTLQLRNCFKGDLPEVDKPESKSVHTEIKDARDDFPWTRERFQRVWGISKTATVVRLKSLVTKGAISISGTGKATRYEVLDSTCLS